VSVYTDLTGRVALVTGAAHGIGLGVANALGAAGAQIVAVDRDEEHLLAAEIQGVTQRVVADLSTDSYTWVDDLLAENEAPSFLFNNVSEMDGRSFLELPEETVIHNLRTNILSQWFLTRRVVGAMMDAHLSGSIVFNLSLHTDRVRMCPDYSVSKAALLMLVQELAFELGPHGIRVNGISPGAIDTWSDKVPDPDDHRDKSAAMIPLGRLGSPEDVGKLACFLADDEASGYITGANIRLDGGLNQFNWLHHLYGSAEAERRRTDSS
jgi:NAD(P)-dependent dehydrogenase (short-subunit alcohol dehydrogenase family)